MDVAARHLVLICALSLLAGGCQMGPDPSIELLESELRWMEDQLYDMDRTVTDSCRRLEACQRENASLRHDLAYAGVRDNSTSDSSDRQNNSSRRRLFPRTRDRGTSRRTTPNSGAARSRSDNEATAPPAVEVPDFDERDLEIPEVELSPGGAYPEFTPDSESTNSAHIDRLRISRIVVNGRLTSGYNADGTRSPQGLMVIVEPQNETGRYVPLPGEVKVAVFDPTRPGSLAQVAAWHLTETEVVPLIKSTIAGRGIHLRMPWPNRPSTSRQLVVQVEYSPPNGRSLVARHDLQLNLTAQASQAPQPETTVPPMRRRGPLRFAPIPRTTSQLANTLQVTPPTAPMLGTDLTAPQRLAPEYGREQQAGAFALQQDNATFDPYSGRQVQASQSPVWHPTRR